MTGASGRTEHSVGEILRRWGPEYSRGHRLTPEQRRTLEALSRCRTAELGGHRERCPECAFERPVYNSCGDRNCPTCQGIRSRRWLAARLDELLPCPYFHCVFTLPDALNALVFLAPERFYTLLFRAAWRTLRALFQRHGLGEPGVIAVLHTWGQTLCLHPHVHCIVTGGGLSADGKTWHAASPEFLLDVFEMSEEFRKGFCRLLRYHARHFGGQSAVDLANEQASREWVVFCQAPPNGAPGVMAYLARYSYRTAIANRRILEVTDDGRVTFEWKDYRAAEAGQAPPVRPMDLDADEFIRRFLQHILPDSFKRIRCFGLLAGGAKTKKLAACRRLLPTGTLFMPVQPPVAAAAEFDPDAMRRCPHCGALMEPADPLPAARGPPLVQPFAGGLAHAA